MFGQALLQSFVSSTSQQGGSGAIVDTNITPPDKPIDYTPLYMIGALSFLAVIFIIFKSGK